MNSLDNLFVRRPRAIRVTPFTPDRADKIDTQGERPLYFIKTREGLRYITTNMLIAEKSQDYRHPMDADVFQREYVNILAYDNAFAAELKHRIAEQLTAALAKDDPKAEIAQIIALLKDSAPFDHDEFGD